MGYITVRLKGGPEDGALKSVWWSSFYDPFAAAQASTVPILGQHGVTSIEDYEPNGEVDDEGHPIYELVRMESL